MKKMFLLLTLIQGFVFANPDLIKLTGISLMHSDGRSFTSEYSMEFEEPRESDFFVSYDGSIQVSSDDGYIYRRSGLLERRKSNDKLEISYRYKTKNCTHNVKFETLHDGEFEVGELISFNAQGKAVCVCGDTCFKENHYSGTAELKVEKAIKYEDTEATWFETKDLIRDCSWDELTFKDCLPSFGLPSVDYRWSAKSARENFKNRLDFMESKVHYRKRLHRYCREKGFTRYVDVEVLYGTQEVLEKEFPFIKPYKTIKEFNLFERPLGKVKTKLYRTYLMDEDYYGHDYEAVSNSPVEDVKFWEGTDNREYLFVPIIKRLACK